VQYLDRALRDLAEKPLFVLALARPEVSELFLGLWARCRMHEMRLKELNRKAIERLVRHVLGDKASPETNEQLARLSEGNAFYLEELIRWAAEGQGDHLPETVVAMVQSRLGALDDESRRLLRAASIFGEVFWTGAVAVLLGGGELTGPVRDRLSLLVDQELLVKRRESRFSEQEEYAFRHALLREGAYGMLTADDLSLGHKLAGEWLEAHGEQDALLLAEHFEKGGDPERAGRHYLRAVEQAHWAGDPKAAILHAGRGIECGVSGDLRIALLGLLCEMHYWRVELVTEVLVHGEELVRIAPQGSAPWIQGMFTVLTCALQAGRIDDFLTTFRTLLEVNPSADSAAPFSLAVCVGVYLLDHIGRIEEANTVMGRLIAVAKDLGEHAPVAGIVGHAILAVRSAGPGNDPASGLLHAHATVAAAAAVSHRTYRGGGIVFVGINQWLLGAAGEAERTLKEAIVPDEELGFASSVRPFALAWLLAERAAWEEAQEWARRLVASGQTRRLPIDEGRGHWVLAEVLRRVGEFDAAELQIQTALTLLGMACPLDVPGALATLAALRLAQGRPAEALASAEDGLSKSESMGACTFFFRGAFLRLIHVECLQATGNHDAAKAAIAKAKQRLFTIADKIADPAYRKSFLENVPENRKTLELANRYLQEPA
jgi:tetratricopeptide (TPR) repeat protein